ncbi:MAG: 3-dehydroquinate dehydratase [bacterium]|nr:3-dehydroquinate dehydratase [bacterium]
MLGMREPEIYGTETYDSLSDKVMGWAGELGIEIGCAQTNSEGEMIDYVHASVGRVDFFIINPGAYTHTSFALRDAISSVSVPVFEVHLSNIYAREEWRNKSQISPVCCGTIAGMGPVGYKLALHAGRELVMAMRAAARGYQAPAYVEPHPAQAQAPSAGGQESAWEVFKRSMAAEGGAPAHPAAHPANAAPASAAPPAAPAAAAEPERRRPAQAAPVINQAQPGQAQPQAPRHSGELPAARAAERNAHAHPRPSADAQAVREQPRDAADADRRRVQPRKADIAKPPVHEDLSAALGRDLQLRASGEHTAIKPKPSRLPEAPASDARGDRKSRLSLGIGDDADDANLRVDQDTGETLEDYDESDSTSPENSGNQKKSGDGKSWKDKMGWGRKH